MKRPRPKKSQTFTTTNHEQNIKLAKQGTTESPGQSIVSSVAMTGWVDDVQ